MENLSNSAHEASRLSPKDTVIENQRPLIVRVIGAGLSGVYMGIRIPQRLRNIDLKIYEKNDGIGGTWWENRYPGCACDIPSHSYQYTFEPNKAWSAFYASAKEICTYIQNVAVKYGATRFIHLKHEVVSLTWDENKTKWIVRVATNEASEIFTEEADVVVTARGVLNDISWPDIPGLKTFKGPIMHSARWDETYAFKEKRVGIIGGGSSSIQIVPELQKLEGAHLSCFVRSKVWISNRFGDHVMNQLSLDPQDIDFTPEKLRQLSSSEDAYLRFRKRIEDDGNLVHKSSIRGSDMQTDFVEIFKKITKERLSAKPELLDSFLPAFGVGCRRMTPGPGYLEALVEDNVEFITDEVLVVNETGLRLLNGRQINIDVLVCATGFNTSAIPPFQVEGRCGKTLAQKFTPFPQSYLAITVDGFPNYFMMLGPNSGIGAGSISCLIEAQGDYIIKCIRKLQKEDYATMAPKSARVKDFTEYAESYFRKTVYTDVCKSWYKSNGGKGDRISGLWPGSLLHAMEAWRAPRWEDYDFESLHQNHFKWLGNGWSLCVMDEEEQGDPSWYLNPNEVDLPPFGKPEKDSKLKARPFSH